MPVCLRRKNRSAENGGIKTAVTAPRPKMVLGAFFDTKQESVPWMSVREGLNTMNKTNISVYGVRSGRSSAIGI